MVGWGQLGIGIWFWLGSEHVRWAIFEQVRPSQRQVRQPSLTVSQPIIDGFMQFVQL